MHQDDALAVLGESVHGRFVNLFRIAGFEVERIPIGGEYRDVTGGEILLDLRRIAQGWEPEEWCNRLIAGGDAHRRDAFLDLSLCVLEGHFRQIFVRPSMRAHSHARRQVLFQDLRDASRHAYRSGRTWPWCTHRPAP